MSNTMLGRVQLSLLLLSLLASGALAGRGSHRRSLAQQNASTAVIYSNGSLEWKSWSWGTSYMSLKDPANPSPGSRSSLGLQLQPFGALSLKSPVPFSLSGGVLGLYLRSSPVEGKAYPVGALELQFESSSPSNYTVTPSISLRELALAQFSGNTTAADALLSSVQAGEWAAIKVDLSSTFKGPAGKYDRLTLGSCLQHTDLCNDEDLPVLPLYLDHIVLVSSAS